MATNLNKTNRAKIVESVIKGTFIPEEREAILKAMSAKVRAVCISLLPEGFLEATKNLPKEWFNTCYSETLYDESSPAHVLNGVAHGHTYEQFESFRIPANWGPLSSQTRVERVNFWEKHLAAELAAAKKLYAKEVKLRDELMAFLLSVKTFEKAIEKMPELEPHLPTPPAKTYPVVVSTAPLRNCLAGLGFDRSQKAVAP